MGNKAEKCYDPKDSTLVFVDEKAEKCYDPKDSTLVFVDVDDLDYCYEEFKSLKAKMSCGHGVTPSSLTNWCRRLLNEGSSSFSCGTCGAKWPYVEVRKMALLTLEEREEFEKTMAFNAAKDGLECKTCPQCNSSVARKDESNLCVVCRMCSITKYQRYEFCWQCLREWKGSRPRSDRCDNEGCTCVALDTLRTCKEIVFESLEGVSGCPSIRACPTCGRLLEHSSKKCKNLVCPRCTVEFCFVCLKITKECLKTSRHYEPCSSGVAPRQTSIPKWRNK
ncbi:putative E3 ubiquitin-protein ligase ARI6 [Salarias fasciatus]|uniref:Putative E3 ubiquitin-protein ligase ARI6 n=1 Tax=Salarias fasciatus TaxID=181472 RepID=A0A672GMG7_SALFA|nr:putative E3 ubiquitin-protein ligase ARI6 [Salarias fasciatus]